MTPTNKVEAKVKSIASPRGGGSRRARQRWRQPEPNESRLVNATANILHSWPLRPETQRATVN